MSLVLYPRAAPNDRLRVWIGVLQATHSPAIAWMLNQNPTAPTVLRQISSVRPDHMLPAGANPATTPRAFTGVYEFGGLQPDTRYKVTASANGETKTLETRTLPNSVPWDLDRSFNVLLVSCFHQAEDRGGLAGTIVSQMSAIAKPHLTLLVGDQVYLDLPTLRDFPDDLAWLAEKFERDYTLNWAGPLAYTEVLNAAPNVSLPDDHEYWNNYPHPSSVVQNSWREGSRLNWRRAATAMFEGFQRAYPERLGEAVTIDVDPISFFLADTRSDKDPLLKFTMSTGERKQLNDWVDRLVKDKKFGVFLSGQSIFRDAAAPLVGALGDYAVGDYELPNYGDFPEIVNNLRRLADAGRPVLCLTGDVHWGRVAIAKDIRHGRTAFTEVISSPASLVTTLGFDSLRKVKNVLPFFGERSPWPRHSEAELPPTFLASSVLAGDFPCSLIHSQRGNHVVMLCFRQHGNGLKVGIKYWPISRDAQVGRPFDVGEIDLNNS